MKRIAALAVVCLLAATAHAQVAKTTITQVITSSSGNWAGTIEIEGPSLVTSDQVYHVGTKTRHTVTAGVAFSVDLWPNVGSSAGGQRNAYRVTYYGTGKSTVPEWWIVPVSATPITIAQMAPQTVPPPFEPLTINWSSMARLGATDGQVIQWSDSASAWIPGSHLSGTYQPLDADLTTIAGLTPDSVNILMGNGSAWIKVALPDCDNATTSKLLFDTTTRTFSCGTDQSSGGGGTFTIQDSGGSVLATGIDTIKLGTAFLASIASNVATLGPDTAMFLSLATAQEFSNKKTNDLKMGADGVWARENPNSTTAATVLNYLAKESADGTVTVLTTSDTGVPARVVVGGAGLAPTYPTALLAIAGRPQLYIDNNCTIHQPIVASTTTGGRGHCTSSPGAGVVVHGFAAETTGGAGLTKIHPTAYMSGSTGVTNGDSHNHDGGDGAQIPTGGIANDAVTRDKVSAVLRTRQFSFMLGADDGTALVDTNDQADIFTNELGSGVTITKVVCYSDGGTPSINLTRNDGTPADILASDLSCSSSGASTTTFTSGEASIADGHRVNFKLVSAGGVAKRITLSVRFTVD